MTKSPVKSFRLNPDLVSELEKESKAQHRTLSNYVEYLLVTHQSRGGGVKKATNKKNKQSG